MAKKTKTTKPTTGEETLRQGSPLAVGGGGIGPNILWGNPYNAYAAGWSGNPMGFPLWGTGYWGTYQTYRFILDHYKIRNVRSKVLHSLLDGTWEIWTDGDGKNIPNKVMQAVKDLMCLRYRFIEDAYWGVDFGWAGFEKIWDIKNNRYLIDRLKPLLHDFTRIITSTGGDFLGLTQGGMSKAIPITIGSNGEAIPGLDVYKALIYTNDKYCGNWYGRGRLENVRSTAWIGWLDVAQQLAKIGFRASGFYPIIKVPAGTYEDATGVKRSWRENGEVALKNLDQGLGIVLENMSFRRVGNGQASHISDPDMLIKLAQASLVDVDVLDLGNLMPLIDGLLKRLLHYEDAMVEGYLHSPREVAEAKHSSKGDTESHIESGELDPMMIASDIDEYFNRFVVNQILELNFGEEYIGKIKLFTPAIKTAKVQQARVLLNTMIQSNHALGEKIADSMGDEGMARLFSDANLKVSKKWSETKAEPVVTTGAKTTTPPASNSQNNA